MRWESVGPPALFYRARAPEGVFCAFSAHMLTPVCERERRRGDT